jgi:hypothetical protein
MAAQSSAGETAASTEAQVQTEAQVNQDANSEAQSSSAAQDAVETTLLDVVKNAVKPEEKTPESSDRERSGEAEVTEAVDEEATAEAEADPDAPKDDSDVPFHKHPRWQEMKRERDSYRQGHEQYEQIQQFMQVNELAPQEVADGFEIMALMRQNPEAALEKLRPFVESLELATGRRLPEDLSKRVEDGLVDEDTARETARLRMEADRARQQAEARSAADAERQALESQQNQVQSIQTAVATVEQEIQASDPDYARKQSFVMDRVRSLIIEKTPRTSEDAVAIVRQAHKEISERLKPMVQRKPVTPATSGDASSSSRPTPASLLDVVRQAASRST